MAVTLLKDVFNAAWLKDVALQGVVLTDLQGNPFPDTLYTQAIEAAVRQVEGELDLRILPLKIGVERHSLRGELPQALWPFTLRRRPIRSITNIKLRYGTIQILNIPASWIFQVLPVAGRLNLIPTLAELQVTQVLVPSLWAWNGNYMPGAFEFDYTAGFVVLSGTTTFAPGATTKKITLPETLWDSGYSVKFTLLAPQPADANITAQMVGEGLDNFDMELSAPPANNLDVQWILHTVPADLAMYLALWASLQVLNVAGTTLLPPGFASGSVSEDGLSQSLTSTQNAQQLAYGNRRDAHQKLIDDMRPVLRGKYRPMNLAIQ